MNWISNARVVIHADALFGLTSTLLVFQTAAWLQRRCAGTVVLNPVLVSVVIVVLVLKVTGISYEDYMRGGQYVAFLLGPATVALALPLFENSRSIWLEMRAIIPAVIVGSLTTSIGAISIGSALGASRSVVLSLSAHSATTPVAMGITDQIGGEPSLAAAFTLLTGLVGVVFYGPVVHIIGIKDWRARGLGVGTAAHGLGTARMLQIDETAGAYAGMAIGLNAIVTAVFVPLVVHIAFAR